jgi:hypothetical protein
LPVALIFVKVPRPQSDDENPVHGRSVLALFLLFFVVVVLFYGIIAIHDIPYLIAKSRHHFHQDAIRRRVAELEADLKAGGREWNSCSS